jgi:hypothetical protein
MYEPNIELTLETKDGRSPLTFPVRRMICSGWVGRDPEALQAHIDELAEHGVPAPGRVPIYLNFSPYLVTTADLADVVSAESSGEVEFVILREGGETYVGVGSDHTDRGFEKYSIPASKQMYAKVLAPVVWPYDEVREHWNDIILRSWSSEAGTETLYQEAALATILNAEELLEGMPTGDGLREDSFVLFSGTPASLTGLLFGDEFAFEMEDPVLGRTIRHRYRVRILPQYN